MYRILIVDNSSSLMKMREYSSCREYNIDEVKDAINYNNIINKILNFKPHIVFINISINKSVGLNILKKLSKLKLETKYIVVGKHKDYKHVREAFIIGADDYIVNPIDETIVMDSILRFKNENFSKNIDDEVDQILEIKYENLSRITNKIIKTTKSEYNKNITLKKIANSLDLNSAYLGRVFLKETNIKFSQYLMLYRLYMAKNLITMSSETISKIASEVGYKNSNYFYTHFNKIYGFSPSELRNDAV
ncbi:response regulator transcription factor [Paraclostridium bifermentans]|uniref:response regulator transcription factor n=1 Tax=Paraclostridium bifermentans TaxID=1490 RepID=UPI00189F861A|nr:response regulator transcription factor [Paraclostridium bifermentans]